MGLVGSDSVRRVRCFHTVFDLRKRVLSMIENGQLSYERVV